MIMAVDFDETLCSENYPGIGKANQGLTEGLKELQLGGDRLILWTCRVSERLEKTVNWCKKQGLVFDAINDNVPKMIERWETIRGKSRRISILMTVRRSRGA